MVAAMIPMAMLEDLMLTHSGRDLIGVGSWKIKFEMGARSMQKRPKLILLVTQGMLLVNFFHKMVIDFALFI